MLWYTTSFIPWCRWLLLLILPFLIWAFLEFFFYYGFPFLVFFGRVSVVVDCLFISWSGIINLSLSLLKVYAFSGSLFLGCQVLLIIRFRFFFVAIDAVESVQRKLLISYLNLLRIFVVDISLLLLMGLAIELGHIDFIVIIVILLRDFLLLLSIGYFLSETAELRLFLFLLLSILLFNFVIKHVNYLVSH